VQRETVARTNQQIAANREQRRAASSTSDSLKQQARTLIGETRYQEALGVIDQILVLDPTNDYASGVRPLVEDKALLQQCALPDVEPQFSKHY
jgi:hypothetical protein